MPIHRSAIKQVRQDKKRTARNLSRKRTVKSLIGKYKLKPSVEGLQKVQSALFRATKGHVIHKNTAARLLSRLAKNLSKTSPQKVSSKSRKKTT